MKIIQSFVCFYSLFLFQGQILKSEGRYEVSVKLNSYSNPNLECANCRNGERGACDTRSINCDNVFSFCLMNIDSNSMECPPGSLSSTVNDDSAQIDFTAATVLGLPNPFILEGLSNILARVQLFVRVIDDDTSTDDDLVDIFRINITGTAAINSMIITNNSGIYDIATLGLSYQVTCTPDGNTCIDYCLNSCDPGTCMNIPTSSSYLCTCPDGSDGVNCKHCQGVNCGPGSCTNLQNSYQCNCPHTFSGQNCTVDNCEGFCLNGGTCIREQSLPSCNCPQTFSGENCSTDLCEGYCSNGGTCSREQNLPSCNCPPTFSGEDCGTDLCEGYCLNGGTCSREQNLPSCNCLPTFSGENCGTDLCEVHCLNGGTCTREEILPSCICTPNFLGLRCSKTNYCFDISCNNGTCESNTGNYTCSCPPGKTGRNCELIDHCYTNQPKCTSNGRCISDRDSAVCECSPGFIGEVCELVDTCFEVNCNRGDCIRSTSDYTCQCLPGLTGKNCELEDYCHRANCSNGTCVNGDLTFFCDCNIGFTGEFCETNIDDCENITCSNRGNCIDLINSFACQCRSGFEGKLCEGSIEQSTNNNFVWIYASVAGVVAILLLLLFITSLGVVLFRTNRETENKSSKKENKSNLVIGDNPVYMMVSEPKHEDDEERHFVNPIYGGPDITQQSELTSKSKGSAIVANVYEEDVMYNSLTSLRGNILKPIKKPVYYEVPVESPAASGKHLEPMGYEEPVKCTCTSSNKTLANALHKASPVPYEEPVCKHVSLPHDVPLHKEVPKAYEIPMQTSKKPPASTHQDYKLRLTNGSQVLSSDKILSKKKAMLPVQVNKKPPAITPQDCQLGSINGSQALSSRKVLPKKKPMMPPRILKTYRKETITDPRSKDAALAVSNKN